MKIIRLSELLAAKYKIANNPAELEQTLRQKIHSLWMVPNKTHNILRACADAGASKAKTPDERKAVAGHEFCKELLSIIDYLKTHNKISMGQIKEALLSIIKLIVANKDPKFDSSGKLSEEGETSTVQFPHVTALIAHMVPMSKKNDRKIRDEQFGKARTGLSRILSISLNMLEDIKELEVLSPNRFTRTTDLENEDIPGRFVPQRAPLSENDIIDFIRQYGNEYGISSQEDWGAVFRDDPQFKQEITTVINALNRGHHPKDAAAVKMQIAEILKNHEERKSSNAPLFEDSE